MLFAQYATEYLGDRSMAATSGNDVIAAALTYLPDIILLDVLLNDISGIDVLRRLRSHEPLAHVPIAAVTALARARDREIIASAGFSDYLAKPYMLEELMQSSSVSLIAVKQLLRTIRAQLANLARRCHEALRKKRSEPLDLGCAAPCEAD